MNPSINELLAYKAYQLRVWSLQATTAAGSGHATSCLSAADIVATLFFHSMHFDLTNPHNPHNDQFILSKGHAAPVLYAALAELGIITHDSLLTLRSFNSVLEGHPTPRCPFVSVATGSLGIGLSVGLGMAIHAHMQKSSYYTYVLLGDSELTEGCIWEAVELAAHYKTNNLVAIIDFNSLGQRGETIDAHNPQTTAQKFEAFGWHSIIVDGHNIDQLQQCFDQIKKIKTSKPIVIIAKTIKGYGVSHLENKNGYHGKALTTDELKSALMQLHTRFWHDSWKTESIAPIHLIKSADHKQKIISLPTAQAQANKLLSPREACGQTLVELGSLVPSMVCLDAEVSNSTRTELFAQQFPNRFIECFIAEQNMIAMATGLAAQGALPFVATFSAFLTRACDQLRMAAISRSALRVIGTHAGISIGQDGPSQMGLEDIACMSTLPDSIILYPCDAVSTRALVELMTNYHQAISYIRITRNTLEPVYPLNTKFTLGGFNIIKKADNAQALIIAAGITVHEALRAQQLLLQHHINVTVVDLYCIKPLDAKRLSELAHQCNNTVITVEDHYLNGGLGQAICYALRNSNVHVNCLAVTQVPRSGSSQELLAWAGIDATAITNTVKQLVKRS